MQCIRQSMNNLIRSTSKGHEPGQRSFLWERLKKGMHLVNPIARLIQCHDATNVQSHDAISQCDSTTYSAQHNSNPHNAILRRIRMMRSHDTMQPAQCGATIQSAQCDATMRAAPHDEIRTMECNERWNPDDGARCNAWDGPRTMQVVRCDPTMQSAQCIPHDAIPQCSKILLDFNWSFTPHIKASIQMLLAEIY